MKKTVSWTTHFCLTFVLLIACTSSPMEIPPVTPSPPLTTTLESVIPWPASPAPALAPKWRDVSAPAGISIPGARWIVVGAPGDREILAAVFYPNPVGSFPVVVILHGTEGFRVPQVELARYFANNGVVSMAGAWFGGHYVLGAGRGAPPVPTTHPFGDTKWPNGPDIPDMSRLFAGTVSVANNALPLVEAARTLSGVQADWVGVFGHSRGASAAILLATTNVQAIVSASGPGLWPANIATEIKAPVFLLHGANDEFFTGQDVRDLEKSLTALGKTVEAYYAAGASHRFPWLPQWRDEARSRSLAFFKRNS